MERIAHLAAALTGLVLALSLGVSLDHLGGSAPQSFGVAGRDAADVDLAEWARERFATAGLALPAVAITFHGDPTPCEGNAGLYRPGDPIEIHLCVPRQGPATAHQRTILHELGHAWAETQTTPATRSEFLALRGLDVWTDGDGPAYLWGAEHAAEAISWALMDTELRITQIYDAEPAGLAAAFTTLTGAEPLVPWT